MIKKYQIHTKLVVDSYLTQSKLWPLAGKHIMAQFDE